MPRDFRPKGHGAASRKREKEPVPNKEKEARYDDEGVSEDVLRHQVAALGGTEEDMALIQGKGKERAAKLTDSELTSELMAFMQKENMPTSNKAPSASAKNTKVEQESMRSEKQNKPSKPTRKGPAQNEAQSAKEKPPLKEKRYNDKYKKPGNESLMTEPEIKPSTSGKHVVFDGGGAPKTLNRVGLQLRFEPVPDWMNIQLPELSDKANSLKEPSNEAISGLHKLGDEVLESENDTYARLASGESGKNVVLGSMNFSDLQFARTLLTNSRASTLSDRISAMTLLLQSSPLHNLKALDLLMNMAGKSNREESSRATRALADWFASGGGLGPDKLRYFRDQPAMPRAAALYESDGKSLLSTSTSPLANCVCLWAFEDLLKRTYFAFVQLLERQTHDTLVFMRRQAVSQVFVLLRDKSEQEHNLLRLLTNKLGDPDRSVASRASTHLMELLQVHPAMKAIVLREVSEAVLRSQQVVVRDNTHSTPKGNQHATYYGVLTLNQTLFVDSDAPLANEIFSVYFQLFDVCLQQEEGQQEVAEKSETSETGTHSTKDKGRWRDKPKTKSALPSSQNKAAHDVYGRLLAGILTGIRRVFPFTTLTSSALDQHLDTLFRITHTHSFNIAVQALQLIFQVAIGSSSDGETARGFSPHVADRYYRILYDSLLDSRLATTSKQAMYLNLVYKSMKADTDSERVKAIVKRLCQVLNLQEPPFIVGALVLLSELFRAKPGLRAMLTEAEDEGIEHFEDVDDEDDDDDVRARATVRKSGSEYDGRKRDPRFAHAGETALWDLLTLVHHYHPSVSLNAMQLLRGEKVTSNADLTLNTLMHFLDRFVFKNPKKRSGVKGSSIMQPSLSDAKDDVLVRRTDAPLSYVNTADFWMQNPDNIPPDQQFFFRYFQTKLKRSNAPPEKPKKQTDADDALDEEERENEYDDEDDAIGSEDEDEKEIWKAMKSSMPKEDEMDDLNEDDDEVLAELEANASADEAEDASDVAIDDADEGHEEDDDENDISEYDEEQDDDTTPFRDDEADEDDGDMFLEDEDDLIPFTNFDDEEDETSHTAGRKRSADEVEEATGKSKERKSRRSKRRALPAFASAEDYAHMLDSDDDGN